MRPHRVRLTHSLVNNYGLNSKMFVHRPQPRSAHDLEQFHCDGARSPTPVCCGVPFPVHLAAHAIYVCGARWPPAWPISFHMDMHASSTQEP
jgi:hypothetical protein